MINNRLLASRRNSQDGRPSLNEAKFTTVHTGEHIHPYKFYAIQKVNASNNPLRLQFGHSYARNGKPVSSVSELVYQDRAEA